MEQFKLTVEEANLLDRIATATKMDCWFYIDEDLHVRDIEEGNISSDAEGVCMLESGLSYGLDEPQSGGLNPEEIKIAEACFRRARAACGALPYTTALETLTDAGLGQKLTTVMVACACRNAIDAFEEEENIAKTPFETFCSLASELWLDCEDRTSLCVIADWLVQWIIHHPEDANYPDSYYELAEWAEENL